MAKSPQNLAIVIGQKAEHAGIFFLLKKEDFRYGTASYQPAASVNKVSGWQVSATVPGRKARLASCEDGRTFEVFSDWSANLVAEKGERS